MKNITAIIIEENPVEAQQIKTLIEKQCPHISITEIGVNPIETKKIISNNLYDIVILGLQTGRAYAFDILQNSSFNTEDKELILISTEKERSVQTFTNAATDYILKPLDPNGILNAIEKAEQNILDLKEPKNVFTNKIIPSPPLSLMAIPSTDDVKIIKINDILYLKSEGKYTLFHTNQGKKIMSSTNLGEYEKKLMNNNFFRIHNSFLVNMDNIINVQKRDGVYVEMNNRDMIPVAKRKKEALFQFLGIK